MASWAVRGVELPFGADARSWWIDEAGRAHDRPLADAEGLPGGYVLPGLVDAHAHPAIGAGADGPVALDVAAARGNLIAWAQSGITLVRDAGSPGGLSLDLGHQPAMPALQVAGRFLAPAGRYFPELLGSPVEEAELVACALGEISRGATWVKVIADFPNLAAGTAQAEPTYQLDMIARLTAAAHDAGARVAAHTTMAGAGPLVAAGIDSVEHGTGLDEETVREMARRGTAWTPTLGATLAGRDSAPPVRRRQLANLEERLAYLLPLAVALGVPVLAGTDVVGSIPAEVGLLARSGLEPSQALAAASVWPRQFLGAPATADIVTYRHDPREDPDQLANPAAVVAGGVRLR
jgi:imidazolonepropionase-like amidohydrolase